MDKRLEPCKRYALRDRIGLTEDNLPNLGAIQEGDVLLAEDIQSIVCAELDRLRSVERGAKVDGLVIAHSRRRIAPDKRCHWEIRSEAQLIDGPDQVGDGRRGRNGAWPGIQDEAAKQNPVERAAGAPADDLNAVTRENWSRLAFGPNEDLAPVLSNAADGNLIPPRPQRTASITEQFGNGRFVAQFVDTRTGNRAGYCRGVADHRHNDAVPVLHSGRRRRADAEKAVKVNDAWHAAAHDSDRSEGSGLPDTPCPGNRACHIGERRYLILPRSLDFAADEHRRGPDAAQRDVNIRAEQILARGGSKRVPHGTEATASRADGRQGSDDQPAVAGDARGVGLVGRTLERDDKLVAWTKYVAVRHLPRQRPSLPFSCTKQVIPELTQRRIIEP